jgi:hypothetical protein
VGEPEQVFKLLEVMEDLVEELEVDLVLEEMELPDKELAEVMLAVTKVAEAEELLMQEVVVDKEETAQLQI